MWWMSWLYDSSCLKASQCRKSWCLSCCRCWCVLCWGSVERAEEQRGAFRATHWEAVSPALCLDEHSTSQGKGEACCDEHIHIQALASWLCVSAAHLTRVTFLRLICIFLKGKAANGKKNNSLVSFQPEYPGGDFHFFTQEVYWLFIPKVERARPVLY